MWKLLPKSFLVLSASSLSLLFALHVLTSVSLSLPPSHPSLFTSAPRRILASLAEQLSFSETPICTRPWENAGYKRNSALQARGRKRDESLHVHVSICSGAPQSLLCRGETRRGRGADSGPGVAEQTREARTGALGDYQAGAVPTPHFWCSVTCPHDRSRRMGEEERRTQRPRERGPVLSLRLRVARRHGPGPRESRL